ncbi:MAG: acyl-CoA reductase [Bacteroidales bacterium]
MQLSINERVNLFATLGKILKTYADNNKEKKFREYYSILDNILPLAEEQNPWFTQQNILSALANLGTALQKDKITRWLSYYPELKKSNKKPLTIGVVNAGNIPFVGFHDFVCILITGHVYYGKLSSKDKEIPGAIRQILVKMEPEMEKYILFENETLKKFDAIIATGSDNSSRYFEYYFGKYPNIIRKNRNSIAVLTGEETDKDITKLADDIFLYFGMGCRNISKIYIPHKFSFKHFFQNINHYEEELKQHNKYMNNYEYNRAIYLMNQTPHLDNGFLLLKKDEGLSSPVGTLFYEEYTDINNLNNKLQMQKNKLQCIVSNSGKIKDAIDFGKTQTPELWDYADQIDTIKFLLSLENQ